MYVALTGSLNIAGVSTTIVSSTGESESTRDYAFAATAGGALTYCIDIDCYSTVSGFLQSGFAFEDQSAVPFIAGGSGVFKFAKRLRLVLEADTGFVLGDINENVDGFLGWYGVRFTSRNIGVDLGFIKPFTFTDGPVDTSPLPMGLPWVSFTYRSLKGDE